MHFPKVPTFVFPLECCLSQLPDGSQVALRFPYFSRNGMALGSLQISDIGIVDAYRVHDGEHRVQGTVVEGCSDFVLR